MYLCENDYSKFKAFVKEKRKPYVQIFYVFNNKIYKNDIIIANKGNIVSFGKVVKVKRLKLYKYQEHNFKFNFDPYAKSTFDYNEFDYYKLLVEYRSQRNEKHKKVVVYDTIYIAVRKKPASIKETKHILTFFEILEENELQAYNYACVELQFHFDKLDRLFELYDKINEYINNDDDMEQSDIIDALTEEYNELKEKFINEFLKYLKTTDPRRK